MGRQYLVLDACGEKVREEGVIRSRAVLVGIGINWDGRRSVLAIELANRESQTSWKDFLVGLKQRGLTGVEFVVSDDHAGLKKEITDILPSAVWQRCYVHFLRNALDYLPRRGGDDCMMELRWLYDRHDVQESRRDLAAEIHENWIEATRYLNMDFLEERKRELHRVSAA